MNILLLFLIFIKGIEGSSKKCNCDAHHMNSIYIEHPFFYNISLGLLIITIFLSSLTFLILLGFIKGLLGLCCCAPVGMWSLGALIDLPRPLKYYQEKELSTIPVVYDETGWPIHPKTRKRSVRILSRKTEFFLNIIFFLAYPLTLVISLCSSYCFTEKNDFDKETHYKCVNTIVINSCAQDKKKIKKSTKSIFKKKKQEDIYEDNSSDLTEEKDTKYVTIQMHESRQLLQS